MRTCPAGERRNEHSQVLPFAHHGGACEDSPGRQGDASMIEVVRSTDVAASPDDVWAVLSDFGAIGAWADNVDHSCLLSEQTGGVGTARRIQTGRTTLVERVVAWEPPSTLSYVLEGLPPVVQSAVNTWHVYGAEDGSRVSLTSRVDAGPRPPQKVVAKVVGRKLAQASDVMLAGLAARGLALSGDTSRKAAAP